MNKKFLVLLLLSVLLPLLANAQAQTTSVTISVTDAPDGQVWANGTYSTTLVVSALGNSNGVLLPGPVGALDASGNATFSLTSVNDITYPTGGVWQVTVCPQMGCSVASFGAPLSSPQVLGPSASYTITPPSFRIQATQHAGAIAYRDSEVVSSTLGSVYFNVTSSQLKFCGAVPCSVNWTASSAGVASGCVSSCSYGVGLGSDGPVAFGATTSAMTASNTPQFIRFYNNSLRKLGNATVRVTTIGAGGHFSVGVYSISGTTGTLIWTTGSQSTASVTNIPVTPSAVNLQPGTNYLVGWCADNTAAVLAGVSAASITGNLGASSAPNSYGINATDLCTAGVLPSTITTTNITNSASATLAGIYATN